MGVFGVFKTLFVVQILCICLSLATNGIFIGISLKVMTDEMTI